MSEEATRRPCKADELTGKWKVIASEIPGYMENPENYEFTSDGMFEMKRWNYGARHYYRFGVEGFQLWYEIREGKRLTLDVWFEEGDVLVFLPQHGYHTRMVRDV